MPPNDSLQAFHECELNQLRIAYEDGNCLALQEAIRYCEKYNVAHKWVAEASVTFVSRHGKLQKKRGRSSGEIPRYREDISKHYARWDLVQEIREAQAYCQREIALLRALPDAKAEKEELKKKELEGRLKVIGISEERAREVASEILVGTFAEGEPDAIKR